MPASRTSSPRNRWTRPRCRRSSQAGNQPVRRVGEPLVEGDHALERLPPHAKDGAREGRGAPPEEPGIHPTELQPQPNRGLGLPEMVPRQAQPVPQARPDRPVGLGLDGSEHGRRVPVLLAEPAAVGAGMGLLEPQARGRQGERWQIGVTRVLDPETVERGRRAIALPRKLMTTSCIGNAAWPSRKRSSCRGSVSAAGPGRTGSAATGGSPPEARLARLARSRGLPLCGRLA